jgi:hypothetical protein
MAVKSDPVWVLFPRWIEESGLPEALLQSMGCEAWLIFRKLVELDCEQNLTPDWFSFKIPDLQRWTGCEPGTIETMLIKLEEQSLIQRNNLDFESQGAKIVSPLVTPINEAVIRKTLAGSHVKGGRFILRYSEDISQFEQIDKVMYLYQMLFGPKFSPKIVQSLEEIANTYDMGVIFDTFSEAFQSQKKSLAWIKTHLRAFDEQDQAVL